LIFLNLSTNIYFYLVAHHINSFLSKIGNPLNELPSKLLYIKFGNNFDQQVDKLPSELKEIIFTTKYKRSLENIPSGIKIIANT
jgi:hypothetical protein